MLKRVLSLCLSVALVLSMVPAQAFATEEETIPVETQVETAAPETEPAETTAALETEPEESVPETTAAETVPVTTEETVPVTREETVPETSEETVPETTGETVPETTEETIPEVTVETVPEETVVEETVAEEAMAASGTCPDGLSWDYTSGTLTISGSTSMSNYTSSTRPKWETYKSNITKVVIKSGVTRIGDYAFYKYENLTSVTIAGTVTAINKYAFRECVSLYSVSIPNSATTIGQGAFYGCTGLEAVYFPASYNSKLTSLGAHAFQGCTSLESVNIPSGITVEAGNTFSGCTSLKEVTIASNPGQMMFENCTALEKVTLSTGVTIVGYGSFIGCTGLKEITIPTTVTSIYSYAFKNSGLKTIVFKGNAPSIESSSFTGVTAKAMYTYGDTTWTSSKCANYGGSLSWSYDNRAGESATWSLSSSGVLTVSGTGDMADYSSYSAPWYASRASVTSIVVKSGITSIGKYAFYGCNKATDVTIPSTVKTIGDYAFQSCSSLKAVTLNSGTTSIGKYAFQGCYAMNSIQIADGVTSIGEYAFGACSGLTSVTIPASVTYIGPKVFGGCTMLEEIWVNPANTTYASASGVLYDKAMTTLMVAPARISGKYIIPDTVTKIENYVFENCGELLEVAIPDSVTTIGTNAFYGCSGLTAVHMGSGVTSIGKYAFYGCSSLEEITIPAGVTDIKEYTFQGCTALAEITLPEGLTAIGTKAFYNCDALTEITVPAGVTTIGSNALSGCDNLAAIRVAEDNTYYASDDKGALHNKTMTTLIQVPSGMSGGYTVADTVTEIKSLAFEGCKKLLAVYIPAGVTTISASSYSYSPFYGCSAGTVLYCKETAAPAGWSSYWNYYSSSALTVKYGVSAEEGAFWTEDAFGEVVTIPSYISTIPANAFYGHTNLKCITIPENITAIPSKAFYGCTALAEVSMSSRLKTISGYAFAGCTGFKAIFIPSGVTTIENYAFNNCYTGLTIYCGAASKPSGWASSWRNSGGYTVWGVNEEEIAFWVSADAFGEHVEIPAWITSIPAYAFYNRTDLKSITIPAGVVSVGKYAFYGCTGLEEVIGGSGIETFGEYAFYECSGLTEAPIGSNVTTIGFSAFCYCTGLTSVALPDSVTTVGDQAFGHCSNLKRVFIPASVTTLSGSPFGYSSSAKLYCEVSTAPSTWSSQWKQYASNGVLDYCLGCNRVTYEFLYSDAIQKPHVVIPEGVTAIPDSTFKNRTDLLSVTFPSTLTAIGSYAFDGCTGLTDLTIPDTVTDIGSYAFRGCTGLTEVTIPGSVTNLNSGVFSDCTALASVILEQGITTIGGGAFRLTALTSIDLPASITKIDSNAFYYCPSLTSINFLGDAPSIASSAFNGVKATARYRQGNPTWTTSKRANYGGTLTWEACAFDDNRCGSNLTWSIENGVLTISGTGSMFNYTSSATAPWYSRASEITKIVVEEGITVIDEYAFYKLVNVTEAVLPGTVTSIGRYAFSGCSAMTEITLPESLTTLYYGAFSGCSGLTDINIPASVTSMECDAFAGCTGLTAVHITDLTKWCSISFGHYGANPLEKGHNLYLNGQLITDLVIPSGITSIGPNVFNGGSFASITFPSGVTRIDYEAFYGCKNLKELNLPSTVIYISDFAFCNCDSLTRLVLPNNLKTVGENAFRSCDALRVVYIPSSVTSLTNCSNMIEGAIGNSGFNGIFTECDPSLAIYCAAASKPSNWNSKWNYRNFDEQFATYWGIKNFPAADPVSVTIKSLPTTRNYLVGGTIDLTGLTLQVTDENGTTFTAAEVDGVRILSGSTAASGKIPVTVTYFGQSASFDIFVHAVDVTEELIPNANSYPESAHNYANGMDTSWTYTCPGAESLKLTFNGSTKVESSYDYIYIYDKNSNQIGKYTGTTLQNKTITVSGDTVRIRLTSDSSNTYYGFYLSSIYATISGQGEVLQPRYGYPQSAHNYTNSYSNTWTYSSTGADYLKLTFNSSTYVESNCDFIYLYDKNDTQIGKYTGSTLRSKTVTVEGDTVKIKLTTDGSNTYYGFGLSGIYAGHRGGIIHEPTGEGVYTAPGCYTDGYTTHTCFCGHSFTVSHQGTAAHTPETVPAVAPTCTQSGLTAGSRCSVCGTILTAQQTVPSLGHSYDSGVVTTAPGCETAGVKTFTCGGCGDSYTTTLAATGHTSGSAVRENVVTETCTTSGSYDTVVYCTSCNKELSRRTTTVAKLGHAEVIDKAVAATCLTSGLTEGKHCSRCNAVLIAQKTIAALGHAEVIDKAVNPTCTATGKTQGKHCSRCSAVLVAQQTIAALGHVEVIDKAVSPTCTATGKTEGKHCSRCSAVLIAQQTIAALGHVEVTDKAVSPTCLETGLTEGKHCSRCKAVLVPQKVVPALGHDEIVDARVEPTCLTSGLTEGRHCTRCEAVLVPQKVVPALGHDEVVDARVEPTCLTTGLTEGKHCARCAAVLIAQNVISALGHDEVIDVAVAPTCVDTGLTEGKHCRRCAAVLIAQDMIPANGHDYIYGICQVCAHEIPSDYQLYASKSLTLKITNPATNKPYTAKELVWEMPEEFDPFVTLKNGKLTAKKVVERVRMGITGTVVATGEKISCLIDIYPTLTQVEVKNGEEILNGKTVLMDFTEKSLTLTADAFPWDTLSKVTWTVSDKNSQYAEYTIDGNRLTISNPVGRAGTVTIKATVDAGVKKNVTVKVTFGNLARVVTILGPEKTTLRGGESMELQAYVSEPVAVSMPGIVWSTSDKNVATVSGDKVTAKNVTHPTTVTLTATSKDGRASASVDLRILPKDEGKLVLLEGGKFVTNATRSMNVGDSCVLSAAVVSNGEATPAAVTWTSAKPAVAAVDENGRITATGVGTAKITAAADGKTAVINIKVATLVGAMEITTKDGKNLITEKGETLVLVSSGKTVTLAANILTAGAAKTVDWAITEGAEYAKISGGKVTANKDLTSVQYVTVKATAKDGSGVSATIRVKIVPLATGVQIFESGTRVRSNTTYVVDMQHSSVIRLSARVYPAKANQAVLLTSSSKRIADFNENGELVCYKTGTVTITAAAQDGSGQKTTFKLTIVKRVTDLRLKDGLALDENGSLVVAGGKSLKLATMVDIIPGDATNKKLNWSVAPNNYGIAISSTGVLTTKKVTHPVTVNIMVTPQDGGSAFLSFNVTVYPV